MKFLPKAGMGLLLLAACGLTAKPAHAQLVTFTAFDPSAGLGDPTPNSDAEAATFDAALGSETLINFESAPVGAFSSLTVAPGVTLSSDGSEQIQNVPFSTVGSQVFGFNTTSGGANYVQLIGGTVTFTFASPIQAFGTYLSGVQDNGETFTFSDGTSQTVDIPNPTSAGGVEFLGFTDFGKQISSLTITAQLTPNSGDIIGVDDVRFAASTATPEPASYAAFAFGGLGLLGLGLKPRRQIPRSA